MAMTPHKPMGSPTVKTNMLFGVFRPWMLYSAAGALLNGNFDGAHFRCKRLENTCLIPLEVQPLISCIIVAAESEQTDDGCYYTAIMAMKALDVGEAPFGGDPWESIKQLRSRIYKKFGTLETNSMLRILYNLEDRRPRVRLPSTSAPMNIASPNPPDRIHPMIENSHPLPLEVPHRHDAYGFSRCRMPPNLGWDTTPLIRNPTNNPSLDNALIGVEAGAGWQYLRLKGTNPQCSSKEELYDADAVAVKANGEDSNSENCSSHTSHAVKAHVGWQDPNLKDTSTKFSSKKSYPEETAGAIEAHGEDPNPETCSSRTSHTSTENCSSHTSHTSTKILSKNSYRDVAAGARMTNGGFGS